MAANDWVFYLLAVTGTVVLLRILRPVAFKFGLVDIPGERKLHRVSVPLVGGLAIWIVLAISYVLARFVFNAQWNGLGGYFVAASMLVAAGLLDDLMELKVWVRLAIQVCAGLVAVYFGHALLVHLGNLWGWGDVQTGLWAVPFTLFCMVGLINAFNMLDGLDGLAGGVALVILFWLLLVALLTQRTALSIALILFASILIGFLMCNMRLPWRREIVFLGDAGSMLLGFTLAWCAIRISQAPQQAVMPAAALWILGLPVLDTVSTMLRRAFHKHSPFSAGRDHLHHLLLAFGLPDSVVVVAEIGLAAILGAVGFFSWRYGVRELDLSMGFVVLGILYLGAVEAAWRFLARAHTSEQAPIQL
ncbi:MAG: MraY family glycosyltransferase [Gammaproteobacteria bacterium]